MLEECHRRVERLLLESYALPPPGEEGTRIGKQRNVHEYRYIYIYIYMYTYRLR